MLYQISLLIIVRSLEVVVETRENWPNPILQSPYAERKNLVS